MKAFPFRRAAVKEIDHIDLFPGSNEEQLPDYTPEFPCITTQANLYRYADPRVPWHWHSAVEVFYIESGTLEYTTPGGSWVFPAGSGGFVNANVLHTSRILPGEHPAIQRLHLFDPTFLAGDPAGRLYKNYVQPLISSGLELIPLEPQPSTAVSLLKESFLLSEGDWGHEFSLRHALTGIWLALLGQLPQSVPDPAPGDGAIKAMMGYVHRHYGEEITVDHIAQAGIVSRRGCFRLFQQRLHTSPTAYLRDYRLRQACGLLMQTELSITEIASRCALGSSSYFGQQFLKAYGVTPSQYRKKWHDSEKI